MIEVVRWYLSAFHAGRNAEVAKKPYNPILGEIFKCHYSLPSRSSEVGSLERKRSGLHHETRAQSARSATLPLQHKSQQCNS